MLRLTISGMTCSHCVAAVERAVKAVPAVREVAVDLASGQVTIEGEPDLRAVRAAIAEEGYEVLAAA